MKRISTTTNTQRIVYEFSKDDVLTALVEKYEVPLPPADHRCARSRFEMGENQARLIVVYEETKGSPDGESPGNG